MAFDKKKFIGRVAVTAMKRVQKSLMGKPISVVHRKGERLGRLLWRLAGKRRRKVLENLAIAFPEKSEAERAELCRKTFEHFGRTFTDFLVSLRYSKEQVAESMEIVGREHLEAAIAEGRGVIILTGHLGHWEKSSNYLSQHGYALTVVARDANQGEVNQMVNELRSGPGTTVIPRGNAARPVLAALKRNELVAILPDQNDEEIFIPFFGKPAGTVVGPGVLAERSGAVVLCAACVYIGNEKYRVFVSPPLQPVAGGTVKGEGTMIAFNQWLEEAIRQYPDQYLWLHDRWRNARNRGML